MLYSKSSRLLLFVTVIFLAFFAGACNNDNKNNQNNGISFNKENARRHVMTSQEALTYTSRFRANRVFIDSTLKNSPYFQKNPVRLLNGEYFNRDAIIALLNQAGDGGIRIYLGQDPKGIVKFILVPATEKTDVITTLVAYKPLKIPGISSANAGPLFDGEVMERGQECPNICAEGSIFSDK